MRKGHKAFTSDKGNIANTRHLTRILVFLKEINTCATITEIQKNICTNTYRTKDALNWLLNHRLIFKYSHAESCLIKYSLEDVK